MAAHNFFLIESNLHSTRFITLAVVPKRGSEWQGRPRVLALGQHRSEETSQRRRAVGYIMSDLTGLGIEPQIFRMISDIFKTTL